MSEAIKFLDGFKKSIDSSLHVAMLAKIVKYDEIRERADIQPIKQGLPMIIDALVVLNTGPYQQGDAVLVVFSDYALDGSSKAMHRLDDAIVVGKVKL